MNRHKLLALAAMLLVPLAACDEGTPPVPVGMIDGQVSIEGQGVDGVTVTLSTGAATTTAGGGRFSFASVDGGTYTLTISNYPADASFTSTSQPATIATDGQTATVNFSGTYIRTASIIGSVTVERTGLSGVTVRISGMADQATQTDANGQYTFTQLRAGTYEVEVSDFGADVGFSNASQNVTVGVGETEAVSFDGTYVRTAGITGRVAIEGGGLAGVTVSLTGIETRTTTTDAAGQYAFAELRAGAYTVGISGFDAEDYEFTETSKSVTVALGQMSNVPFDGTRLRTAGISGQVSVEGDGIAGVMVALSGAAEATDTTDLAGQYAFSGLAAGTYMVKISGYDAAAYMFEEDMKMVELADDQAAKASFEGMHTRTASVSGQIFLDANENDEMDVGDEDPVMVAGLTIALLGPGVTDVNTATTDSTGMFMFESLRAGVYRVLLRSAALDPKVLTVLGWPEGVVFGGNAEGYAVQVTPSGTVTQNLPFDITLQTLTMQAMMGDGDKKTGAMVKGVGIDLYPTFASANAGRNQIGDMVMTDSTGTATFKFARALDTSPGGNRDYVVFAKVVELPHDDLVATANDVLEITYSARTPVDAAEKAVQLLNRRATFQFWVKNIETEVGGDDGQEGWISEIRTSPGNKGFQTPVDTVSDKNGLSIFSDAASADDLPVKYYIRLAPSQTRAMGEAFMGTPEPSDVASMDTMKVGESKTAKAEPLLIYEHDGIMMPGDTADLGVLRVKWTTQTLVVGVHYERTHVSGYDANIIDGDVRPSATGADSISVTLQTRDKFGTPRTWRYPKPATGNRPSSIRSPAKFGPNRGLVIFADLPADTLFLARATASGSRVIYGADRVDTFLGSDANRRQASRGDHSSGAFGPESGTGPVVRICPLGTKTECSTFGYGFNNGIVGVSAKTRAYTRTVAPIFADSVITAFGADSIQIRLTPAPGNLGDDEEKTAWINRKSCRDADNALTNCTGGTLNFEGVGGGRYEISMVPNSAWSGVIGGARTKTVTLFSALDTDGSDQRAMGNAFTVSYQKTMITGTVANDIANRGTLGQGNGTVHSQETVRNATMSLSRVSNTRNRSRIALGLTKDTTFVKTAKTNGRGVFEFEDLAEGDYVVTGASTTDYDLRADNTKPTNVSPTLTTTAVADFRKITSGTGAGSLPRWSYGDHDRTSTVAVNSEVGLAVLDANEYDADFIVLFKDGQLSGRVTQPDDFGKSPDAEDSDDDPDPYAGLTVRLQRCGAIRDIANVLSNYLSNLGPENCPNIDDSFEVKSTTTDSNGAYAFSGLREGFYAVLLDLSGVNHTNTAFERASFLRLLQGPADSDSFKTIHIKRTGG